MTRWLLVFSVMLVAQVVSDLVPSWDQGVFSLSGYLIASALYWKEIMRGVD